MFAHTHTHIDINLLIHSQYKHNKRDYYYIFVSLTNFRYNICGSGSCILQLRYGIYSPAQNAANNLIWLLSELLYITIFLNSTDSILWKLFYITGCLFVAIQNMEEWQEAVFDKTKNQIQLKTISLYASVLTLWKKGEERGQKSHCLAKEREE